MRQLITGVDARGRSCVVGEHPLADLHERSPMLVTFTGPADALPRPPGNGEDVDLQVPPGVTRLAVARWASDFAYGMHHTDTIDFDTILEGSATLVLDDGRHLLERGDVAVVTGVDHAWEAGPEGTTISFVFVGTPAPQG
jgi:hypothetical protein